MFDHDRASEQGDDQATGSVRVAVIEAFPLMRHAIVETLEQQRDMHVVASCASGESGVRAVVEHRPDVAILELHLPDLGGQDVVARLRESAPDTRVLVYTACAKEDVFMEVLGGGAAGYLTKQSGGPDLLRAVRTVGRGGSAMSPQLAGCLVAQVAEDGSEGGRGTRVSAGAGTGVSLCRREADVLRMVARGCTDKEIGRMLYISPRTVQHHLAKLRAKTDTRRRGDLVRWAMEHTWI